MNWDKAWASRKVRQRGKQLEAEVDELRQRADTLAATVEALSVVLRDKELECRLRAKLIQALRDVNAHLDAAQYREPKVGNEAA